MTKKLKFNKKEKAIISKKLRKLIKKILDKDFTRRIDVRTAYFELLIIIEPPEKM